jgi:hypothetical protein
MEAQELIDRMVDFYLSQVPDSIQEKYVLELMIYGQPLPETVAAIKAHLDGVVTDSDEPASA